MSKEVKNIFSFDVFVPKVINQEEVTKNEDGSETVTRKKVDTKVPVKIVIKSPNRKIIEEADNFYAKECNRYMKDGFLTRSMIGKLHEDMGGAFSESRIKDLQTRFGELPNLEKEASTLEEEAKKLKESGEEEQSLASATKAVGLRDKMTKLQEEFAGLQQNLNSIYEHSSETKSLNGLIRWFILMLTHIEENGVSKPLFPGKDYKEKLDYEYKLSDENDLVYSLSQQKLAGIVAYWYFRKDVTDKELEEVVTKIEKGEF